MTKSNRSTRSSALKTAALVITVLGALYFGRDILIPLAFATTLALILTPAVSWLRKMRVALAPAVLLMMTLVVVGVTGISYVIFNQLVEVLNELPRYQSNIHNKIEAFRLPRRGSLGRAAESVKELGKELTTTPETPPVTAARTARNAGRNGPSQAAGTQLVQIVPEPVNEFQYVRDLTRPFLGPLAELGIVLIFAVFLLFEQSDLRNRLLRLVGVKQLNLVTQALDDVTRRVSKYLLMQLVVNASFGGICGLGLYLIGVPYAALWGAVAAILRIVPYVGSLVAGLLPLVLSLAVFDSWRPPVLVFLLFAALEIVTGNFIEPYLYGVHTGISALALLLTTVFWAALWGPAGLILSTPLTVCVVVLGRYVPQLSFLHILLGDEPVLSAEAQVYQRLLALDDQEARTVIDQYLTDHSLLQLYDSVLIPALAMAEHDRHKGALDAEREEFLFLSVKELLAEFSSGHSKETETARPENAGRIFCLPASDEADEITASMLAQLLEQTDSAVISFPLDTSMRQMLELTEPNENDVFCISSLPPFAFARATTLSRQLRLRYPKTKMIVGVWGFPGEAEQALQRFQAPMPDKLAVSLADAMQYVAHLKSGGKPETERSPAG